MTVYDKGEGILGPARENLRRELEPEIVVTVHPSLIRIPLRVKIHLWQARARRRRGSKVQAMVDALNAELDRAYINGS